MLPERVIRTFVCFMGAGAVVAGQAFGGMILTTRNTDEATGKKHSRRTFVLGAMIRTEEPGKASILRPDLGRLWEIPSDGSTCLLYTAADLARMQQTASESVDAPAPVPGTRSSAAAPPPVSEAPKATYRKLASSESVGKWRTDRFAREIDGVKTAEVWVVPLSALKVRRSELAALEKAEATFGAAPSVWDQEILSLLKDAQMIGYEAFPVKIAEMDGSGKARTVSELSRVDREKIPYRNFQPPSDCTKAAQVPGR